MTTTTKTLRINIPDDGLANWMTINNLLAEKAGEMVRWTGVLFDLVREYESHQTGSHKPGLASVVLSDSAHTTIETITATGFQEGDFLYIAIGKDPAGDPSTDPVDDAKKLWNEGLHNHVKSCTRGIILWKHRDNEIRIKLANESDPNDKRYEFDCDFAEGGLEIKIFRSDGAVEDLSGNNIRYIDLQPHAGPDPKDVLNPPRYPTVLGP